MMKIACISFTAHGSQINKKLEQWFTDHGETCDCRALARYAQAAGLKPLENSFRDWCREHFAEADVMIFIGATGIAVRGIAPWVKDKKTDPAVLVIDEQGKFVISLLSGHIGGANDMAREVARLLDAVPVITTGTDVNNTFAVDAFAVKNQLQISDMTLAKEIAARLIDRQLVGFASDLRVADMVSNALTVYSSAPEIGVCITVQPGRRQAFWKKTLFLTPKNVHLGIGCRRGTPFEVIEERVQQVMSECGLDWKAVAAAASIDLKKDEEGLKEFCRVHEIPFTVYSAEELNQTEGSFTPSKFVGTITGVDNVCERAAALDCIRNRIYAKGNNLEGGYHMIQKKTAGDGVTVAAAMEDWSVRFE